jgi:hypothetical protein
MGGIKPEQYGEFLREKSILFGDDHWGKLVYESPIYKEEGRRMKKFLFVPHPALVMAYPELQRNDVDWVQTKMGEAVWRAYPMFWVNDTNNSRSNAIVRIYCTFDGQRTPETQRVDKYVSQIKAFEAETDRLIAQIIILQEENKEALNDALAKARKYKEIQDTMKGQKVDDDDEGED